MTERFTLLEKVGRGGMGVVWRARDEETGQIVALKLLHSAYSDDPEYITRFERELELASRIKSANVVGVIGYGVRDGTPYLALEFVDGQTLRQTLAAHGPYTWDEAKLLLGQVAHGLADAHAAGVFHRDIKPSNILIGSDGVAKIADFGIARGLDLTRVTGTSTLLGTPAYLPPEGPQDGRSDLYSLGIVAYELMAGVPPFEGSTFAELLMAHVRLAPDLEKIPAEARPIVGSLLEKDPNARPQSASELIDALEGQRKVAVLTPVVTGPRVAAAVAILPSAPVWAGPNQYQPVTTPHSPPQDPMAPGPGMHPATVGWPRVKSNSRLRLALLGAFALMVALVFVGSAVFAASNHLAVSSQQTPGPTQVIATSTPPTTAPVFSQPLPDPTQAVAISVSFPAIRSVSGISAKAVQTIRIDGAGFGQHAPYKGVSEYIELADLSGGWNAGWHEPGQTTSDIITLIVRSWKDSEIVLGGLGGSYGAVFDSGGHHYDFRLKAGQKVRVRVWNPQSSAGPAESQLTVS
jgi:serine/threonine-protein kinase